MTVFLHVGQCGISLAQDLWSVAYADHIASAYASPLFHADGSARCILVDTEPKVIQSLRLNAALHRNANDTRSDDTVAPSVSDTKQSSSSTIFRGSNVFYEQYGRGNNWAMGYAGPHFEEQASADDVGAGSGKRSLTSRTLESMRKEAERCDVFTGCVMTHSVSGGTGAGLGSRLLQSLRTEYPKACLLDVAVTPFRAGDTPLQHFNALMTLSHLHEFADAVLMFSNEDVLGVLKHSLTYLPSKVGGSKAARISFANINQYIARALSDVLFPTEVLSYYDDPAWKPVNRYVSSLLLC